MDRWIIGDFTTGRLVAEIQNPGPQSNWHSDITGGDARLELIPSERTHRAIGEQIRDHLGYSYYAAAINDVGLIEYAGPIIKAAFTADSWQFDCDTAWDYLARRAVVAEQHWVHYQTPPDQDPPLYTWSGTWREIIAGIWLLCFNRGYRFDARPKWEEQAEAKAAWRDFFRQDRQADGQQSWLDPPIIPTGDKNAGGGGHNFSVEMIDLDTVAEVLHKISSDETGVEIMIRPTWVGQYPEGAMLWRLTTGTDAQPLVVPSGRAWPLDMSAPNPTRHLREIRLDGEQILTSARVLGGRTGGDGTPFVGWANNLTIGHTLDATVPELDVTSTRHTPSGTMPEASNIALGMAIDGARPGMVCTVTVAAGGMPDADRIEVGDFATLYGGDDHPQLPPGEHRMRVTAKSRSADGSTSFTLERLRWTDVSKYSTLWEM